MSEREYRERGHFELLEFHGQIKMHPEVSQEPARDDGRTERLSRVDDMEMMGGR